MKKLKKAGLLMAVVLTLGASSFTVHAEECSSSGCNFPINSNSWYVCRLYECIFHRWGAEGIPNWTARLNNGLTRKQLVACFLDSPEFSLTYSDNCSFVNAVFEFLLLRSPGAQGLENYVNKLNSGKLTRIQLIQAVKASPEYQTKTAYIPSC